MTVDNATDIYRIVNELMSNFKKEKEKENIQKELSQPVIIGYLNRKMGYGGFYPMEIGTPIYQHDGRYYIEEISIKDNSIHKVYYYYKDIVNVIKLN